MNWPWGRRRRKLDELSRARGLFVVRYTLRGEIELRGFVEGEALRFFTGPMCMGSDPQPRWVTRVIIGDGRRADDTWIDIHNLEEPHRDAVSALAVLAGAEPQRASESVVLHETAGESRLTILRPLSDPEHIARALDAVARLRRRRGS